MIKAPEIKNVEYQTILEKNRWKLKLKIFPVKGRPRTRYISSDEWSKMITITKEGWLKMGEIYLNPVERALRKLKL